MNSLETLYSQRYENGLKPIALELNQLISELVKDFDRVDRVTSRAKDIKKFIEKANVKLDGKNKYSDPINEIQDQIGVRIIVFYLSDVSLISDLLLKYFRPIESRDVVPDREWEFGYFGRHHLFLTPKDAISNNIIDEHVPKCFEMQIKTLFQHAWSEANHDLGYKSGGKALDADALRKLAFTSAQAWGADQIFEELYCKSAE